MDESISEYDPDEFRAYADNWEDYAHNLRQYADEAEDLASRLKEWARCLEMGSSQVASNPEDRQ